MKWITRERPKIDRVACPWLIARFIDREPKFLFAPPADVVAIATATGATPYDVEGVELSHDGPLCSFDALVAKYDLGADVALRDLAIIVRGADTDRLDLAPQCAGLLAISLGLSRIFSDDHEQLRHGFVVYDALYAWLRGGRAEAHTWNPQRTAVGLAVRVLLMVGVTGALVRNVAAQSAPACSATSTSVTPPSWHTPVQPAGAAPTPGLRLVDEIALPGQANRFDYQSVDPASGRIYMNHMNAGRTVVFDADHGRVITEITDVPRATGVLAIPSHHQVYVSAAGAHEVVIVDDRTLKITSRVAGIRFPDGIAYAPDVDKVFVSDESGGADMVIDAKTGAKRSMIDLGGEAGNTHYDSVSHCVLVAVQTKNQIVAIDPVSERVVQRYDLPGSDHPHGFTLDEPGRLAFISCEGNAALLVVDLRKMKVVQAIKVAGGPDVLAWDAAWRRLYVASEGGALQAFWLDGSTLRAVGEIRAPHAHTVAVDPRTHRVYLPLENIAGSPRLRIYEPAP